MSHDHDHFLNEAWKIEEGCVGKIVSETHVSGLMQNFYNSIPNKEKMTPTGGEVLEIICMDGRLDEREKEGSVYVRDGGQGILRDGDGVEKIADGYVHTAMEMGVQTIRLTSHDDCGAWGLSGKSQEEGNKYYNALRESIAEKIETADLPVEVVLEHLPAKEENKEGRGLCLPHIERAAYYAYIPSFNPQAANGLPAGFVVSREHFNCDYAIATAAIAVKIAFGGHGFGNRFSLEQPFLLVAIADTKEKLEEAERELEKAKQEALEKYLVDIADAGEKILVTGFMI